VSPRPSAERNHWKAGRYRIELAVTAKDVPARRYEIQLVLDGVWTPNTDQWAHFMLSGLKALD
jgi:hypothetical protein